MPYTNTEIAALHKQLHEGGGRRQDRVRSMFTQAVTVTEVIYGRDGIYCRVKREGSTVESAPIRMSGTTTPAMSQRLYLIDYYYHLMLGDGAYLAP